jgi:hypothetical protein
MRTQQWQPSSPAITYLSDDTLPSAPATAQKGPARGRVVLAGAAQLAGALFFVALHVLPASRRLRLVSEPLSQYAFDPDGWLFDAGVLTLAFGLLVLVSALVRGGCLPVRSWLCCLLVACALSMVLIVMFPEHDASGAMTAVGDVHWAAAMIAFGGLACAPALLKHHRVSRCARLASLARRFFVGTAPCFLVVAAASLLRYEAPLQVPAWPFGLGERALVAMELALSAVLTAWAWNGCTCNTAAPRPLSSVSVIAPS